MSTKKIRRISAVMAGGLVVAGITTATIATTGHTSGHATAHATLAAYAASMPPVNLDNCPTLAEGYHGGCVNQLQTELNADDNANLSVDGTFGPATKAAVEAFQTAQNIIPADGIVGPQTKAALDNPAQTSVATPNPANLTSPPATGTSGSSASNSSGGISGLLDSAGLDPYDVAATVGCGLLGVGVGAVATPVVGFGVGTACGLGAITPPAG